MRDTSSNWPAGCRGWRGARATAEEARQPVPTCDSLGPQQHLQGCTASVRCPPLDTRGDEWRTTAPPDHCTYVPPSVYTVGGVGYTGGMRAPRRATSGLHAGSPRPSQNKVVDATGTSHWPGPWTTCKISTYDGSRVFSPFDLKTLSDQTSNQIFFFRSTRTTQTRTLYANFSLRRG